MVLANSSSNRVHAGVPPLPPQSSSSCGIAGGARVSDAAAPSSPSPAAVAEVAEALASNPGADSDDEYAAAACSSDDDYGRSSAVKASPSKKKIWMSSITTNERSYRTDADADAPRSLISSFSFASFDETGYFRWPRPRPRPPGTGPPSPAS